jgi:hypothetical protein
MLHRVLAEREQDILYNTACDVQGARSVGTLGVTLNSRRKEAGQLVLNGLCGLVMQGVRRVGTGKVIIDLTRLAKTCEALSSVTVIIAPGRRKKK